MWEKFKPSMKRNFSYFLEEMTERFSAGENNRTDQSKALISSSMPAMLSLIEKE
jgi:hypothetical protein